MAAPKVLSNMNNRQKVTAIVFVVIVLIILYMVYGMFKGESAPAMPVSEGPTGAMNAATPGGFTPPQPQTPKQAQLAQTQQLSPREAQLLQMQQETEMKYLDALNQLQMLKLERDIAETNKAIASAKLDTITAQEKIVTLLKPPVQITPATYAQGLVSPTTTGGPPANMQPPVTVNKPVEETNYSVISVSLLQSQWNAVVGYQGNLYNVHVGDILPVDGSKVLSIDKSGLIIEKDGVKRKLSMVPII